MSSDDLFDDRPPNQGDNPAARGTKHTVDVGDYPDPLEPPGLPFPDPFPTYQGIQDPNLDKTWKDFHTPWDPHNYFAQMWGGQLWNEPGFGYLAPEGPGGVLGPGGLHSYPGQPFGANDPTVPMPTPLPPFGQPPADPAALTGLGSTMLGLESPGGTEQHDPWYGDPTTPGVAPLDPNTPGGIPQQGFTRPFTGATDPYALYSSAIPVFREQMQTNLDDAMAGIGLGNRFSSYAANEAAKVASQTGLQQQQMLQNLMYDQANQDLDRAMQASLGMAQFGGQDLQRQLAALGTLGNLGQGLEQIQRGRLHDLYNVGQWQQQRADQAAQTAYQDFMTSRRGWVPELLSYASGVPAPQPQPVTTQSAAGPGLIDMIMPIATAAAGSYFGGPAFGAKF